MTGLQRRCMWLEMRGQTQTMSLRHGHLYRLAPSELKGIMLRTEGAISQRLYKAQFHRHWCSESCLSRRKDGSKGFGVVYSQIDICSGSSPIKGFEKKTFRRKCLRNSLRNYEFQVMPFVFDKRTCANKKEHEEHLKQILELLKKEELYAKFSKCEFWIPKVLLDTIEEIIEGFSNIRQTLTKLTQRGIMLSLNGANKQEAAYQLLKPKVVQAPILALPEGKPKISSHNCDAFEEGFWVLRCNLKNAQTESGEKTPDGGENIKSGRRWGNVGLNMAKVPEEAD
ncbi:hypothetical protein Tco_0541095 [Tanacetum coccineum]